MTTKLNVWRGSGNVFADLGLPDAEELLVKANLMHRLSQSIQRLALTQREVGRRLGIDQPKVSALLNGRLANFSSERLMRLLTALGQDIEIVVKSKRRGQERGRIRVVEQAHA